MKGKLRIYSFAFPYEKNTLSLKEGISCFTQQAHYIEFKGKYSYILKVNIHIFYSNNIILYR